MRPTKYKVESIDEQVRDLNKLIKQNRESKTILKRAQILLDVDSQHGRQYMHAAIANINRIRSPGISMAVQLFATQGLEAVLTINRN